MTDTRVRIPLIAVTVLALILTAFTVDSRAGIRLDGTEFQAGSQKTSLSDAETLRGSRTVIPASRLVYTFGQAVLAKGEIPNPLTGEAVKIGLGYDFNAQNTTIWGCTCQHQGDLSGGEIADATDVNAMIDILFFNAPNVQDPLCPASRVDLDCDGYPTAIDLSIIVNITFYNGAAACQPCAED